MPIYSFQGMTPVVDPSAYVHPSAVVIGDVIIGAGVFVAPCAVLRGDFGRLVVEEQSNIQDHCVMHGFPDRDTIVEKLGHIGHHAIIHGAIVRRNAMIGMGAVLLDYCEVGADSIVAAQALVRANEVVPPRSMMAGIPAKRIRDVTDKDLEWKRLATRDYQRLPPLYHQGLKPAEPLKAVETNRPRAYACESPPKHEVR
jgi:carbonic anhydrase/acetyltransferase-like protein (isoleucine patch superfamily)